MSGNPTGSNVVPMPHAATPATAPPQMPMPFPMWSGGSSLPWGPGCCPPGGMDALMKCYCDVQAATAFICSVMVQCIQTNPAVTAAIIAAIEASGSSLPLVGVTNGSDAQPGQVGEWISFVQNPTYATGSTNQSVTMGVLQPGDWDMWAFANTEAAVNGAQFFLNPVPPGVEGGDVPGYFVSTVDQNNALLVSPVNRGLFSVPTLIAFTLITNTTGAGGMVNFNFLARRRR